MDQQTITITDGLVRRIRQMQAEKADPALMLRVAVNGGGCQGFEYAYDITHDAGAEDRMFDKDGIKVVIDLTSLELLNGAIIDFVDEMAGASFKIRNPNAQSTCGCGTSFSLG
jgi:iron-sulfur cluster insertion protein